MSSKSAQARHDAAVLPRIRDLEAAGQSLREIADQLQADGFPPPRKGSRWSHIAVKRILERAGKAHPQTAPTTLSVSGPVHMTGQVTITTAGPVNARGPVNIHTADPQAVASAPSKESAIILMPASSPHALSSPPRGMAYELPSSLAAALIHRDPFFLRRRA